MYGQRIKTSTECVFLKYKGLMKRKIKDMILTTVWHFNSHSTGCFVTSAFLDSLRIKTPVCWQYWILLHPLRPSGRSFREGRCHQTHLAEMNRRQMQLAVPGLVHSTLVPKVKINCNKIKMLNTVDAGWIYRLRKYFKTALTLSNILRILVTLRILAALTLSNPD